MGTIYLPGRTKSRKTGHRQPLFQQQGKGPGTRRKASAGIPDVMDPPSAASGKKYFPAGGNLAF